MTEAQRYVWEGAIPLQIHLHESEVASHPPPLPALILAPRIGYIPIGVLFDLLCSEPERPWNLTVHFGGYPSNLLIPCEGEDSVKWNFINSLKEADYIINGNCKNVMNMSQSDQLELWQAVINANLESYLRASAKLRLGTIEDQFTIKKSLSSVKSLKTTGEADASGQMKTDKVPIRLYLRCVGEDFEDLEDLSQICNWDEISYINRPVQIPREEGKCFTLYDALQTLLPEFLGDRSLSNEESCRIEGDSEQTVSSEDVGSDRNAKEGTESSSQSEGPSCSTRMDAEIKLVRVQGIEPKLEIPFSWMVNNLKNPEHFLHICVCLKLLNAV